LLQYKYYNFAKINNDVIKNHLDDQTDLILLCNDDIEFVNDAITFMVRAYTFHSHEVGTIGCRLVYENGKVQHAGQVLFTYKEQSGFYLPLSIGHKEYGLKKGESSDFPEEVISNTGALSMTSRDLFLDIGGFNEKYVECFEDMEFNIECIKRDKKNLYLDYAHCVHYEAVTRKKEQDGQQLVRQNFDFRHTLYSFLNENLDVIKPYIKVLDDPNQLPKGQYPNWGVSKQYELEQQI
jgi:GT2 family glycosyltransferase